MLNRGGKVMGSEFFIALLLWFIRAFISSLICLMVDISLITLLTRITTKIREFKAIKGDPIATACLPADS